MEKTRRQLIEAGQPGGYGARFLRRALAAGYPLGGSLFFSVEHNLDAPHCGTL